MKAVVLAAGEGSRMWPLAETRPKHLLPIAGKPLIGHVLSALAAISITDVLLVVGFREEMIRAALGTETKFGVHLQYLNQTKWTGTASAVNLAREYVDEEQFLVLNGDLMLEPRAIKAVVDKAHDYNTVIGLIKMDTPSEYGVVDLAEDRALRISEKPRGRTEGWVNTGIYVLSKETFRAIGRTKPSKRGEYEITSTLQLMIEQGVDVRSAEINAVDWMDVGRPWELLSANERALLKLRHNIKGTVESGAIVKEPVWLEESATIRSGSRIEGPVYVGKNSVVGPNARIRAHTSIEDNVHVGANCDVKNSIIMRQTKVPHLSYIGDSIIGEECNLGAGTITANLRFDEKTIKITIKGRTVDTKRKKLGVIMGDRVKTGIHTSIMPGVRIGSGSLIGAGAVVNSDVGSGERIIVKQGFVRRASKSSHSHEHGKI
ncbi:MAG: bifunctional sugar-1-phosphate nucleotidylyltransferase/acetyltransferase [Candidatus Bathyarchaeia archaeon]